MYLLDPAFYLFILQAQIQGKKKVQFEYVYILL
jgi:hypothetical protein